MSNIVGNLREKVLTRLKNSVIEMSGVKNKITDLENRLLHKMESTLIARAAAFVAYERIGGDYLEFGVFQGGNFYHSYAKIWQTYIEATADNQWNSKEDREARQANWDAMRFFAFDSFQGLPELKGIDKDTEDFAEGKFACSEEEFTNNLTGWGMPLDRVIKVPGWFDESLTDDLYERYSMKKAAIIYVDCDLYESTIDVLRFVTPLLQDGTIVIFDDWFSYRGNPNYGEQRAAREWLEQNPDWVLTPYQVGGIWKNGFIANNISKSYEDR